MAHNSTTFPPPEPLEFPTVHPRPLMALETPPHVTVLPSLPSPPRKSLLDKWYTLTTHLTPAAYPRETPYLPEPQGPEWSPNKDEFKLHVKKAVDAVVDIKEAQWNGKLDHLECNRRPMWNCVNRYVRRGLQAGEKHGVTLFLTHSIGFPKEMWEPVLERLISGHADGANYRVDEIWLWEAVNHGDACLINRDSLGGIFDWRDNARDILHFLLYYLPTSASPNSLPTHLPRVDDVEAQRRLTHGPEGREILHIAPSFGACCMLRVAIEHQILFKHLYLVEAQIRPKFPGTPMTHPGVRNMVRGAIQRRDSWASREDTLQNFATSPFFRLWDPECLKVYVECGLHQAPGGRIVLKMPSVQEAACFAEEFGSSETFELLAQLDEWVETRWIIATKILPIETEMRKYLAWRRPANSTHRIMVSGHLIAHEMPSELAQDMHDFIKTRYGSFKAML